jgi:hypothetical protein
MTCIQAEDGKIVNLFLQCRNSLIAGTGSEQGTREGSGSEGQHNDCRHDSHQQTGTAGGIALHSLEHFHIYREIQMGSGAKSNMRKGFIIYEEMRDYLVIVEEVGSHT